MTSLFPETRECLFSTDRLYRYKLDIKWGDAPPLVFIGLNPSTADESKNDPTVRRCICYASDMGRGGLLMLNLAAYRSTDPKGMLAVADPIGQRIRQPTSYVGHSTLRRTFRRSLAWGTNAACTVAPQAQVRAIVDVFPRLDCLKLVGKGHPGHPLYLNRDLRPVGYSTLGYLHD
jgi:hypothetical protein